MSISNHFPKFIWVLLLVFGLSYPGELHPREYIIPGGDEANPDSSRLNEIFAPEFVGRPPDNAFNGLVKLPDGELRHYGFEGNWFNPSSHIYICSLDNGFTWHKKVIEDPDLFANENMPPAVCSPYSGDFIRLIGTEKGTFVLRSSHGIDGPFQKFQVDTSASEMIRLPVFLGNMKRILVSCGKNIVIHGKEAIQSCVYYSDDDGHHWNISRVPLGPVFKTAWPHEKPRWQNYAIEPTLAELGNGRIWMLLRTSMDQLYESYSADNGTNWSSPVPSRFYATLTMPNLFRLRDGRLLLFFCNTTPLPEQDRSADTSIPEVQKNGLWEDVFTNRDALHATISEDNGLTWKGFRELYLNPLRNESDFATRGGKEVSLDKSVQQSQAVELPYGKILIAFGQHPLVRSMIIFDPDWLNETERYDDFGNGLMNWSTFKYIDGIKGHCAYNRVQGPDLVDHPNRRDGRVLNLRHVKTPALVCDVDGAVWNFPSALKGSFTTRIYLKPGGKGGRISLIDRWFNPTDTMAYRYAMYSLQMDGTGNTGIGKVLIPGTWVELTFEWDNLQSGPCSLKIDGKPYPNSIALNFPSINGINYVHFQAAVGNEDKEGFLIESVKGVVKR